MHANLHIIVILSLCLGGLFDFGLALQLSIHPSTYHTLLLCLSLALMLVLCLCRLDLSQLFAGFKDKEILIELLCNSTSQCINRQLDINRPLPLCVCVHLHVCLCVVCGGLCTSVYVGLKAFILIQLESAVICFCTKTLHLCWSCLLNSIL